MLQGVRLPELVTLTDGGGTVLGICGVTRATAWGSLTSPGAARQFVGLVPQPVTEVVLPDKAVTPPDEQAPTPVSGLAKVTLITVLAAVFTFPFEPRMPMYFAVLGFAVASRSNLPES